MLIEDELQERNEEVTFHEPKLQLEFKLTPMQNEIAKQLSKMAKQKDVLLYAVCGAGKTEMMLELIRATLLKKKRIAIAIPRRQVVLELCERLSRYFPNNQVIAVAQGFTTITYGELIVCTTHQLYRYTNYFDVVILDEPDAFPYKNNPVLQGIAKVSCKGIIVYSTATPDLHLMERVKTQEMAMCSLYQRPHGFPLIVPKIKIALLSWCYVELFYFVQRKKKEKRQVMVFCATIVQTQRLFRWYRHYVNAGVCTSKSPDKDMVIRQFREKTIQFLFCTTVLERGVTFAAVDVVVFQADHLVFDEASLVQIAGRVGRKKEAPDGECVFLATSKKKHLGACVERIQYANKMSTMPKK